MEETGQESKLTAEQKSKLLDTLFEHSHRNLGEEHALFPRAMYFVASGISTLIKEGNASRIDALAERIDSISTRLGEVSEESKSQQAAIVAASTAINNILTDVHAQQKIAKENDQARQKTLRRFLMFLVGLGIVSLAWTISFVIIWIL